MAIISGSGGYVPESHKRGSSALDRTVGDDAIAGGGGDSFSFGEAAAATGIGAVVGFGVGAAWGGIEAHGKVMDVPIQTRTETWQEPVTHDKNIGSIPHNQYFPAGHLGDMFDSQFMAGFDRPNVNPDLRPTEPVVRPMPELTAQGDPVYQDVTKTFSGHGEPVLHTESHVVTTPTLQGFNQNISDDTHYAERSTGRYVTDSNGNRTAETESVRVLDGVRVNFSPKVVDTPVNSPNNTYITKNVTFDSGVDTAGIVLTRAMQFAGIGAAAALIGDVAKQVLANRHQG